MVFRPLVHNAFPGSRVWIEPTPLNVILGMIPRFKQRRIQPALRAYADVSALNGRLYRLPLGSSLHGDDTLLFCANETRSGAVARA